MAWLTQRSLWFLDCFGGHEEIVQSSHKNGAMLYKNEFWKLNYVIKTFQKQRTATDYQHSFTRHAYRQNI